MKDIEKWVKDKSLYPKKQYVKSLLDNNNIDNSLWIKGYGGKEERTYSFFLFNFSKGGLELDFPLEHSSPFYGGNKNKYHLLHNQKLIKEFDRDTPIQIITKEVIEVYRNLQRRKENGSSSSTIFEEK